MDKEIKKKPFKTYGFVGLLLIVFAETAIVLQDTYPIAREICLWTTPICWWGYIFFLDALIYKIKGKSLISNKLKEFFLQLLLSVVFWIIFEIYNLYLLNWEYINLPENIIIRYFGYIISFVTIMPGMFLTAELLETIGIFRSFKIVQLKFTSNFLYFNIVAGLFCLTVPLLVPQNIAAYLFCLVWVGFIFLLEPIAYSSGVNSLYKDLESGTLNRTLCLLFSGLICGFLWEFWNYWAVAKWVYTAPFTQNIRIFEMPLIGFLGFAPFACEFFVMYSCVKLFVKKSQPLYFQRDDFKPDETTIY